MDLWEDCRPIVELRECEIPDFEYVINDPTDIPDLPDFAELEGGHQEAPVQPEPPVRREPKKAKIEKNPRSKKCSHGCKEIDCIICNPCNRCKKFGLFPFTVDHVTKNKQHRIAIQLWLISEADTLRNYERKQITRGADEMNRGFKLGSQSSVWCKHYFIAEVIKGEFEDVARRFG
jgi:hypothetical protein